ncbi:GHKL domain-containing protein [bacterium]|nr:MAG: GHKL domain-containing protein [bacterium]
MSTEIDLDDFIEAHIVRTGNAGIGIFNEKVLILLDPYMSLKNIDSVKAFIDERGQQKKKTALFTHGHYDHGLRPCELEILYERGFTIGIPKELKALHHKRVLSRRSRQLHNLFERYETAGRLRWLADGTDFNEGEVTITAIQSAHATVSIKDYAFPLMQGLRRIPGLIEHITQPEGNTLAFLIEINNKRILHLGSCAIDKKNPITGNIDILALPLSDKPLDNPEKDQDYLSERHILSAIKPRITIPIHDDPIDKVMEPKDAVDFTLAVHESSPTKILTPLYQKGQENVMDKEICCKNWRWLFDYIESADNLASGLQGKAAIKKILERLVDNPRYLIRDPSNPSLFYPVEEKHITDGRYWHSNEFSLQLFDNAAKIIGGYRPLLQAGIIAGYRMMDSAQPRRFPFIRLLSTKGSLKIVSVVNNSMNHTKIPRAESYKKGHSKIKLNYKRKFRAHVSEHVCDWNAGIYIAMGKFTAAHDIRVTEIECLTKGGKDCVFDISWTHFSFWRRFLIFLHSLADPNYIKDRDLDNLELNDLITRQEGIIQERTGQYKQQKEMAEKFLSELQAAYSELKQTQDELIRQQVAKAQREKELQTEKAMSGGLAHEGRNALMPAAIQIRRLMDYQEKQSAFDILSSKSGSLLNHIIKIENEYGLPQESINKEIIPIFREINDLIKDINKMTEEISTGVGKGLGLIDLFRSYSKTQEMTRGEESIDVSKIANKLGETYKKRLSESGITYTVKLIDTVPVITGDYLHIESIIKNIFLNALDALEKAEEKKIDITISKIIKDDIPYLRITVADTGEGIPVDQYEKIFQAFYTTKAAKGTGLGLSIVKRLVEIYEGSITFESQVGKGTTFSIELKIDSGR